MTELGIALVALIAVGVIVVDLKRPGRCLRYSFLCAALYLTWVAPQLAALSLDVTMPKDGLLWLVIMAVLGLGLSLIGWRVGTAQGRSAAFAPMGGDVARLFWPTAGLTAFVYLLHILIGLQSEEALHQSQWSGPLTIIAFFLNLSVVSLYLSLLLVLRRWKASTLVLAGVNVVLSGAVAFIGIRRGVIVDFGIAVVGALWFGARRRVPFAMLLAGVVGMAVVSYAIGPLRSAAIEVAEKTGSNVGLLSHEVWEQVDFAGEIETAARRAPDFANAVHLIDYANRWGEFTYGRQSWDALVFQWVPAQIVGADLKNALMFQQGMDWQKIGSDYSYTAIFGTTSTGFGFAYQEFAVFGALYFLLIAILMGRLWPRADAGDVWAQALYVSFAGPALHSVTHHAMWLIVKIPLFLIATFILRQTVSTLARHGRRFGAGTVLRR
jgi:hypothetical protein